MAHSERAQRFRAVLDAYFGGSGRDWCIAATRTAIKSETHVSSFLSREERKPGRVKMHVGIAIALARPVPGLTVEWLWEGIGEAPERLRGATRTTAPPDLAKIAAASERAAAAAERAAAAAERVEARLVEEALPPPAALPVSGEKRHDSSERPSTKIRHA